MERKIKLSVIVPVYNTQEYLCYCLDSLRIQKYPDVEFILVDDGSTDNSLELCRTYEKKDDRFVVIHKENGGPSGARNLGIEMARGEYIAFVDSDDMVEDGAYERIAQLIERHNNPDVLVFGAHLYPNNAPEHLYRMTSPRDVVYDQFSEKAIFDEAGARPFLWLQVMKKSLITENDIKMDESINLGEDQLFQFEVLPRANKIVFVSDKLYTYRWYREDSIMSDYAAKHEKKMLAHVGLIDKVFSSVFGNASASDEMKQRTFAWSIFFLWSDLTGMLEEKQQKVASSLVEVWEKHGCKVYEEKLDIWGKMRSSQIKLMSISDADERISAYDIAIKELEEEIGELKKDPNYKQVEKALKNRDKESLLRKFFKNLRENGVKVTFCKILRKLRRG